MKYVLTVMVQARSYYIALSVVVSGVVWWGVVWCGGVGGAS